MRFIIVDILDLHFPVGDCIIICTTACGLDTGERVKSGDGEFEREEGGGEEKVERLRGRFRKRREKRPGKGDRG